MSVVRWAGAAAASLAAHAVLVLAVVAVRPAAPEAGREMPAPIEINLTGALPQEAPAPGGAAAVRQPPAAAPRTLPRIGRAAARMPARPAVAPEPRASAPLEAAVVEAVTPGPAAVTEANAPGPALAPVAAGLGPAAGSLSTGPGGAAAGGSSGGTGRGASGDAGGGVGAGGGVDLRRVIAEQVAAHKHYPVLARRRGVEGLVVVEFTVAPDGGAVDLEVLRSAGAVLDQAACEAVRRARPLPLYGGRVQVPVRFRLSDSR